MVYCNKYSTWSNLGEVVKMRANVILYAAFFGAISTSAATDPIAWWQMDKIENGKVADASGNGRDLTVGADCFISNTVHLLDSTFSTLYYPGTTGSWASCSCPALTNRTLVLWLYREAGWGPLDASVNSLPYLCSGVSRMNIQCNRSDAAPYLTPWYNGSPSCYPQQNLYPYKDGWHQIAFAVEVTGAGDGTYLPGRQRLYVDGVLKSDATTGKAWTAAQGYFDISPYLLPASLATASTAYIGNNGVNGTRPIYGHLADMRLYDQALTTSEIQELYEEKIHGQLLAHWNMEAVATDGDGKRFIAGPTASSPKLYLGDAVTVTPGIDGNALWFNPTNSAAMVKTWSVSSVLGCQIPAGTVSLWFNMATNIKDTTSFGLPSITNAIPRLWNLTSNLTRLMVNSGTGMDRNATDLYYYLGGDTCYRRFWDGYLEKGCWSHLTLVSRYVPNGSGTYTGQFDIYVNGERSGATTSLDAMAVASFLFTDTKFTIGATAMGDYNGNNRVYMGLMDDFRVYAGALTADEIRAVYRGPAKVDAGRGFTTASETTTLRGAVAASAELPYRKGYAGDLSWELVNAPTGGEAAVIETPASPVTRVKLPVEGTYTFRLTSTAMSVARTSDVTVTRIAAASGNTAPAVTLAASVTFPFQGLNALAATVSDPDSGPGTLRTSWKKISGPGGVWFEPANSNATEVSFTATGSYVLRCTAEDGQDATSADIAVTVAADTAFDPASLTNGLFAFYPFTGGAKTNFVAGGIDATLANFLAGAYTQHFDPAPDGLGYRGYGGDDYANLGKYGFGESGTTSAPTDKWRAISLWMYHDAGARPGGRIPYNPSLVSHRTAFDLIYFDNPLDGNHGFWAFQAWGGRTWGCPAKDPANRWTHVVALLDRRAEIDGADTSELWIDGVKQTHTAEAANRKSRSASSNVAIGGCHYSGYNPTFHPDYCVTNATYGITTRTFPGVIDEVRFYNRKLTGEEIRHLSAHPVFDANKAPSLDPPARSTARPAMRKPLTAEVTAHDDALPYDSSLTYTWQVVKGDASNVVFSASTARATTATFAAVGDYTLQLTVSDGQRTTYSDPIDVTVVLGGTMVSLR